MLHKDTRVVSHTPIYCCAQGRPDPLAKHALHTWSATEAEHCYNFVLKLPVSSIYFAFYFLTQSSFHPQV